MPTKATASSRARALRAEEVIDPPALSATPVPAAVQFASAWLDAAVAWQAASWATQLEAMRLMQQALRPDTWMHVAEEWAYVMRNGPIPD